MVAGAGMVLPSDVEAALFCDRKRVTVNLAAGERPTNGNDVIWGTNGVDVIRGRAGNDTICGRGGHDAVIGGTGRDVVFGGRGNDGMIGGTWRDRCIGGPGNDAARCETTSSTRPCSSAYPGVCIPPLPPDLDCGQIAFTNFRVRPADPHNFDTNDADVTGCETN
jgi:hypothetical protein